MAERPDISFDLTSTPQSLEMSIDPATVITVPIDPTLSIAGQAADAQATGTAIAAKGDPPRIWQATIAVEDWTGSGPYTYVISANSVTARTVLGAYFRTVWADNMTSAIRWETTAGTITLTTNTLPTGTLHLTLVGWEV